MYSNIKIYKTNIQKKKSNLKFNKLCVQENYFSGSLKTKLSPAGIALGLEEVALYILKATLETDDASVLQKKALQQKDKNMSLATQ